VRVGPYFGRIVAYEETSGIREMLLALGRALATRLGSEPPVEEDRRSGGREGVKP
jgi:hypothetical protein